MLTRVLKRAIRTHADSEHPKECCGVIVEGKYYQCRNVASNSDGEAQIHPDDIREFDGKIEAYVHSHPNASSRASQADLVQMEFFGKPYIIVGQDPEDFSIYHPSGYQAPLIGRKFFHGVLDCYSLVKDFYERELGINIPDFDRQDKWWEDPSNESLYIQNFKKAGFIEVDDMQYGDVIITTVGNTVHPNHALIYLASNGKLKSEDSTEVMASSLVLHHMYGRKSLREIYGDQWKAKTNIVVRHKELIK